MMKKEQEWLEQGHILQIKDGNILVAEKPAVFYHGEKILTPDVSALSKDFAEIQTMQSNTKGLYAEFGHPMPAIRGSYLWLRVKGTNGVWSDWMCRTEYLGFMSCTRLAAIEAAKTACVLQSKKRPEVRNALLNNIKKKSQLGNIIASLQNNKVK